MEKGIIATLSYFAQFEYAPSFAELHRYHNTRVSETALRKQVAEMVRNHTILCTVEAKTEPRYTLGGYSIFLNNTLDRDHISRNKLKRTELYLRFLIHFDVFSLVGLSGSVAMMNATETADIDLFIITCQHRMWTARLMALAAAAIMGLRRGRRAVFAPNKVCLNMFMDEADLKVPKHKQTLFIAHEILQMKPVFERGAVYDRFLKENAWIYRFFPNARGLTTHNRTPRPSGTPLKRGEIPVIPAGRPAGRPGWGIQGIVESLLRFIQLFLINRHKTTEIVTDTQLWFFPKDYERKITA